MSNKQLILFDGVCHFCNDAVNFVIKRDRQPRFVFAPIQSPLGQALMEKHKLLDKPDTFVLITKGECKTMSNAAIAVVVQFGGLWRSVVVFKLIPTVFRDYVYQLFGRHRYTLFGMSDQCLVPDSKYKSRFIGGNANDDW